MYTLHGGGSQRRCESGHRWRLWLWHESLQIPGCPPVTTGAWFAAAVASCSPGIPSSPAHAGTRRLGARGARPAPAPCPPHIPPSTHPSAGPPRLTLAHARKSRFVSNARQFSMARYLSSHPDRRITASTTCRSRPVQCPGPVRARCASPPRARCEAEAAYVLIVCCCGHVLDHGFLISRS